MWSQHPDIKNIVVEVWKQPQVGCPMYILKLKIKSSKTAIKSWNVHVFSNVHNKAKSALEMIDNVQQHINLKGRYDVLSTLKLNAQKDLQDPLDFEESCWREKSRVDWFSLGDRNIAFFHKIT